MNAQHRMVIELIVIRMLSVAKRVVFMRLSISIEAFMVGYKIVIR